MLRTGMALMLLVTTTPAGAQVAARGSKAFTARCAACHSIDRTRPNGLGPNLAGLGGRVSGTAPGFRYSPALTRAKIKWDAKTLDPFLQAPLKVVPGSRMVTAVPDVTTRADIVAFLLAGK